MTRHLIVWGFLMIASCTRLKDKPDANDSVSVIKPGPPIEPAPGDALSVNTGDAKPQDVVSYAKTLIGIPYKYASTDPAQGFDCSGFITYVFKHFDISVPRSSVDFTNVPREIPLSDARPGDLVLFTGTDSTIRVVGHMGIIVANENGEISFIHSTSGKAYGVTITPLNKYYMGRFVKIIRLFRQNN